MERKTWIIFFLRAGDSFNWNCDASWVYCRIRVIDRRLDSSSSSSSNNDIKGLDNLNNYHQRNYRQNAPDYIMLAGALLLFTTYLQQFPIFTDYHGRLGPTRWLRKEPWNFQLRIPKENSNQVWYDLFFVFFKEQHKKSHLVIVSLNDLQEQSGSILHRFRENLQQVAIVIVIHQNVKLLQFCH